MKTKLPLIVSIVAFLLLAFSAAHGQTVTGIPVPPSDESTWTDSNTFYAGMLCATGVQAFAFLVRAVRQVADHGSTM